MKKEPPHPLFNPIELQKKIDLITLSSPGKSFYSQKSTTRRQKAIAEGTPVSHKKFNQDLQKEFDLTAYNNQVLSDLSESHRPHFNLTGEMKPPNEIHIESNSCSIDSDGDLQTSLIKKEKDGESLQHSSPAGNSGINVQDQQVTIV